MENLVIIGTSSGFLASWYGFSSRAYTWVTEHPEYARLRLNSIDTAVEISTYEGLLAIMDIAALEGCRLDQRAWKALFLLHNQRVIQTGDVVPFDYQNADADTILFRKKNCLLLSEAGTGKTFVAIIAGSRHYGRKLIVAPASLLHNWAHEIRRYLPEARIILQPDSADAAIGYEWVLVSYDYLLPHQDTLPASMLIVDEAHYVNAVNSEGMPATKRAQRIKELANDIATEYCLLLTATPCNYRRDMYGLLEIINAHEITNHDYQYYLAKYCKRYLTGNTYDYLGASSSKTFRELLSKFAIRRLRKNTLIQNGKIRKFIPILTDSIPAGCLSFGEYTRARVDLAEEKVFYSEDLIKTILASSNTIICFSCFVKCLKKINLLLEKDGITSEVFSGRVSLKERESILRRFEEGATQVLLISMGAGATGINLQTATHTIFNDLDYVPNNWVQAESRTSRMGQVKECHYYYLYAENNPIEERMYQIIRDKIDSATAYDTESFLLDLRKEVEKNFNKGTENDCPASRPTSE